MEALVKKLNYAGQTPVFISHLPTELAPLAEFFRSRAPVVANLDQWQQMGFGLAFVTTLAGVEQVAATVAQAAAPGDCTLWLAYPKGSSKKYRCEFNRDTGWAALGAIGYEPVRQVALNDDWSALRFRRVAFIKTMTRSFAMTEEGKAKAGQG
ncbi:MAG: hypothetical protein MUC97_10430 [Bernardetiaceae bacterium]|jgi:hypothetical protein|nr:hypothetical protein [Bernardetiaceae bacterium]